MRWIALTISFACIYLLALGVSHAITADRKPAKATAYDLIVARYEEVKRIDWDEQHILDATWQLQVALANGEVDAHRRQRLYTDIAVASIRGVIHQQRIIDKENR